MLRVRVTPGAPPAASTCASPLSCILQMHCRAAGQWFQMEAGFHQNWMRDYDPTTGRYIEADPLGLVPGPSLYGYAGQNPFYWTDPTGECPWCVVIVGAVIGGAVGYNETGCWQGAVAGAVIGGAAGLGFNGLVALGVDAMASGAATGATTSAVSQIAVNKLSEICGCDGDPIPISNLVTAPKFWFNNAIGGLGGAMGGFVAESPASSMVQWAHGNTGRQLVSEFIGGGVGYGASNPINTIQDIVPGGN